MRVRPTGAVDARLEQHRAIILGRPRGTGPDRGGPRQGCSCLRRQTARNHETHRSLRVGRDPGVHVARVGVCIRPPVARIGRAPGRDARQDRNPEPVDRPRPRDGRRGAGRDRRAASGRRRAPIRSELGQVRLGERDITSAFRAASPTTFVGLVTGSGRRQEHADAVNAGRSATASTLEITNYPITGPVTSGPWQQPFICQTDAFALPDGIDARRRRSTPTARREPSCSTSIARRTPKPAFKPLPSAATSLPADLAKTTTVDRRDRQLHRARRDRHDEPRHLPERDPARSDVRSGADAVRAAEGLEPAADRACMARAARAAGTSRAARMGASTARRRRASAKGYAIFINTLNHPTNSCNAVRRRRNGDDGQRALHRNVRRAVLHDDAPADRAARTPACRSPTRSPDCSTASTSARRSPTRCRSRSPGSTRICSTHYFDDRRIRTASRDAQKVAVSGYRGHEGVHRRRQPVAAHRSGSQSRRHRGLPVGRAGTTRFPRRSATIRSRIRRARGRRSSTRRETSTASIRRPAPRSVRSTTSASSTA